MTVKSYMVECTETDTVRWTKFT